MRILNCQETRRSVHTNGFFLKLNSQIRRIRIKNLVLSRRKIRVLCQVVRHVYLTLRLRTCYSRRFWTISWRFESIRCLFFYHELLNGELLVFVFRIRQRLVGNEIFISIL